MNKLNCAYISGYLIILLNCLLCYCGGSNSQFHADESTKYQGHYKVGKPYQIKSVTYYPQPTPKLKSTEVGIASWYGKNDHKKKTANGDTFNKYLLTAAHPKLPMPSIIKVTNLANNKSLILMVNDRGPFYRNRVLDVSEAAAEKLNFKDKGHTKVKLEYLHDESQELLTRLKLRKKEGSRSKSLALRCSASCYVEMLNAKHNLLPLPADRMLG